MTMRHYSWPVSPYSAKTRSYLHYQGIEFDDIPPTVWQLYRRIQGAVGRMIMPTVELEDGTWLQDSSNIIDHFEARDDTVSITPPTAGPTVASSLLEVFSDEWLPMADLHYRWNLPENASFAIRDFAAHGLPRVPGPVGRRLIRPIAKRMAGYLPVLGVTEHTIPGLEQTVATVIAAAEATLSTRPFLFGGRPSLGDFSLYGPLWAHLYRDPASRYLFDAAPSVVDWMDRLTEGATPTGPFEPEVPGSLDPLFQIILDDQLSWNRTLIAAIDAYCEEHPDATRVPRALGVAPFHMGGRHGERKLITFVQWKAQRTRDTYEASAGSADAWLRRLSDLPVDEIIPRVRNPFDRVAFKEVLRQSTEVSP